MDSFFPAFFDKPVGIRFREQEPDEVIELFLRRHWITNVPWILTALIASLAPFVFLSLAPSLGLTFFTQIPANLLIGALTAYYLLLVAYIFEQFLFWYFNIYIVTNHHIVDVQLDNILNREVVEIGLQEIESVSARIQGLFPSLFNFGDVIIQTAARSQEASFSKVPHPDLVEDRINDLKGTLGGGP